jgi:hypothetical protein
MGQILEDRAAIGLGQELTKVVVTGRRLGAGVAVDAATLGASMRAVTWRTPGDSV